MRDLHFASANLLEKFRKNNCCSLIPENKRCKVMDFQSKQIIVVCSSSSLANGVEWITAYNVVPKEHYKDKIYTYDEHVEAIINGTLQRGYKGVEINSNYGVMVVSGKPFTIKPGQETKTQQLSFF